MVILSLLLFTNVFLATSLRIIVLSIPIGVIGGVLVGTIIKLIKLNVNNNITEEIYIVLCYFSILMSLIFFAIKGKNSFWWLNIRQISLVIAFVLTVIFPAYILDMLSIYFESIRLHHIINSYSFWISSLVFTYFLWNILYFPVLQKIQTIPVNA